MFLHDATVTAEINYRRESLMDAWAPIRRRTTESRRPRRERERPATTKAPATR